MLSAVIRNGHSYRAVPLAGQLVHHRSAHPGPLVLGATPLNSPARTLDRDRTVSQRAFSLLIAVAEDPRSSQHLARFISALGLPNLHLQQARFERCWRATAQSRTVSQRSEPSSRTALMGEQPNPWEVLPPQDATSRHRGAKPRRRCERLGVISLLSPG